MHHTGVILHTVKSVSNSEKLPLFLNEHEAQNATMEELPNRRLELSFEEMELTLDKIWFSGKDFSKFRIKITLQSRSPM